MIDFKESAITYGELRAAFKGVFPDLKDDDLNAAMFAIWARILLTRMGVKFE